MAEKKVDIAIESLREFIQKFEASLDPRMWAKLIREEKEELLAEIRADTPVRTNVLKEASDLMYVTTGFNLTAAGAEQLGLYSEREHGELMTLLEESATIHEEAIELLGDVDYIEAFRRVHQSNMSKLGDDGKPIKRDDGKIMKGPNYKPPKLDDLTTLLIMPQDKKLII